MRLAALFAAIALGGCGQDPVVIDGSSPENFLASAEAARRDLPVRDRLAFDIALRSPPGKRFADKEDAAVEIARQTYHGMTANEVVEIAGRR